MRNPLILFAVKLTIVLFVLSSVSGCASRKPKHRVQTQVPSISDSSSLDELLIYHEGLRLKPYRDGADRLTIGVGRNLDDTGISREEALMLLHNDIERIKRELDANLPWWRSLSEARQKVLVSMAFNLGTNGLLGFSRMLSYLQDGDYSAAAEEMLSSIWANQVGNRALELAEMMENG